MIAATVINLLLAGVTMVNRASAQDPVNGTAQTSILSMIQTEVAAIYAYLEDRIKAWNQYVKQVNQGINLLDGVQQSTEYMKNYTENLKEQSSQISGYVKSFESGGSFLDHRFREFNLEAQAAVKYFKDLSYQAGENIEQYDTIIEKSTNNPEDAEKIKQNSGKRSVHQNAIKAYDSIATSRVSIAKANENLNDAKAKLIGSNHKPEVKAKAFDVMTQSSKMDIQIKQLEQQALTNELLINITQLLSEGRVLTTDKPREIRSISSIYNSMQGVSGKKETK